MKAVRKWHSRSFFFPRMREAGGYIGQSRPEKDSAAAGIRLQNTERAGQNGQECCQVGLQQNLVYFFECLIICTGAALQAHTCWIYFSVWSYKYLQVWRCETEEIPMLRHEYGVPHLYWLPGSHNKLVQSVGSISTSCTHFRIKTKEKSILVTPFNRMAWHRTKIHVWDSRHYLTVLHMYIQN